MHKNPALLSATNFAAALILLFYANSTYAEQALSGPCSYLNDSFSLVGRLTNHAGIVSSSSMWYSGEQVSYSMGEPVEGEPETLSLIVTSTAEDGYQEVVVDKVQFPGTVSYMFEEFRYINSIAVEVNPRFPGKATLTEAVCKQTGLGEPFPLNAGFNDAWYDPALNGQGFSIIVYPSINSVFLAMYTFETERPADDQNPVVGDAGHRWLTAFGPYTDSTADLSVDVTTGGVLLRGDPAPEWSSDGSMTLRAVNCRQIELDYSIPSIGEQGSLTLQRVVEDGVKECESLVVSGNE